VVRALIRNVGTYDFDDNGKVTSGEPARTKVTDAGYRGGMACSSEEASVMGAERRG